MDCYGFWNPAHNHFCDVIVYKAGQNNTLTISPTEPVLDTDAINHKSIGYLPGTCFVVSVPTRDIYIGSLKLACFVATASHVAFNYFSHCFKISNTQISFSLKRKTPVTYRCFPIKDFSLKYLNPELISPTNCNPYFLPGDLALLGILQDPFQENSFIPLIPAPFDEIQTNKDCTVIGHPVRPQNLNYCLPQEPNTDENNIKIEKCFCGFSRMVKSNGTINNFDDRIIEVKCSTTNGMSGSPIIINTMEGQKYIGLYLGGPPLPYQRCLKLVQEYSDNRQFIEGYYLLCNTFSNLSFVSRSEKIEVIELFEKIAYCTVTYDILKDLTGNRFEWKYKPFKELAMKVSQNDQLKAMNFELVPFERLISRTYEEFHRLNPTNIFECFSSELEKSISHAKKRMQDYLEDQIYNILTCYSDKSALTFNIGISIKHSAFQELLNIANTLSRFEGTFQSVEAFLALIT